MPDHVPALRLTDVSKSFGGIHAVDGATMSVAVGERRALIGPNGAGKTTLFNLIAGALGVDRGSIELFGELVTKWPMRRRAQLGLGRTYQTSQLFLQLTVEANLFLAGAGVSGQRLRLLTPWEQRVAEREWVRTVAGHVGLHHKLDELVSALSHGEQRQLEIGMALAMRPRLIMLDEPSSGLSPAERTFIAKLIEALPSDITLILIEHHMELALGLADKVTVLHRGRIISDGSPDETRANPEVQSVYLGGTGA
jgi:branched-chain amino acid transport system ATP-binding protein